MTEERPLKLRAVVFEDGGVWVAQCVDYDIAAFAETLSEAPRAFARAVAANLSANADLGRAGLEGLPPAPGRFVALFEAAELGLTSRRRPRQRPLVKADLRVAEPA